MPRLLILFSAEVLMSHWRTSASRSAQLQCPSIGRIDMLNVKSFRFTSCVLAGVELMRMIRKGQFAIDDTDAP